MKQSFILKNKFFETVVSAKKKGEKKKMANNNITMSDSCSKSVVNRKRKNKELSKEDEEMKRMILQADNPFKMASELEEIHIKYTKSVSDMKLIHRRMKSLYNNASSLIDEQREQRFGIKPRLRAIRRVQQRNISSINILMDNINEMDYRLPSKNNNAALEVDNLASLIHKQLWVSPMMEQQTPLSGGRVETQNVRGHEILDGLRRNVSVYSDDEERPAAKRQRRSFFLNEPMLSC